MPRSEALLATFMELPARRQHRARLGAERGRGQRAGAKAGHVSVRFMAFVLNCHMAA